MTFLATPNLFRCKALERRLSSRARRSVGQLMSGPRRARMRVSLVFPLRASPEIFVPVPDSNRRPTIADWDRGGQGGYGHLLPALCPHKWAGL